MRRSRSRVWKDEKNKIDAIRKERAKKLLEYKGGKCQRCGYNKCSAALDYHHVDQSKKKFTIASSLTRSMSDLIKEVDKCILICSNCHREIHANELEVSLIKRIKDTRQIDMF